MKLPLHFKKNIVLLSILCIHTSIFSQSITRFKGDNDLYGYKNDKGEIVIEAKYRYARELRKGYTVENIGGQHYIIDSLGKEYPIPGDYQFVSHSVIDQFPETKSDKGYGRINLTGKEIIPPIFDRIEYKKFKDGTIRFLVWKNNKMGIYSDDGKELAPPKYEPGGVFDGFRYKDNISPVTVGGKYDKKNDIQIGGKWGFINKDGKEISEIKYDGVDYGSKDLFKVNIGGKYQKKDYSFKGGKWGYIDSTGKEVVPVMYEELTCNCNETIIGAKLNGKWGFISPKNETLLPFVYDSITGYFKEGKIKVKQNGREFYIDETGKEIP